MRKHTETQFVLDELLHPERGSYRNAFDFVFILCPTWKHNCTYLLDKVDCHDVLVLGTCVAISDTARDLGAVIDRELSLAAHVTAVCRSGYNQLRQLRPVVRLLSMNATKTLVQAFISCHLDYCNSLLYGVSDGLLQHLQSVQNAPPRLVTGARRSDHIAPVLRQLHWLPVRQRSRSRGSCISRSLVLLRRILLTTVIFCLTLVVTH